MHNQVTTWAQAQIGKPWVPGGRGPDVFDCWGLVHYGYQELLGKEVSLLDGLDPKDLFQVADATSSEIGNWEETRNPSNLTVVAMSKRRIIHHVGLWVEVDGGLVLHCMDKSTVVAQNLMSLRSSNFTTIKYYQLRA